MRFSAVHLVSDDFVVGSLMNALSSCGGRLTWGEDTTTAVLTWASHTESDEKSGRRSSACPVERLHATSHFLSSSAMSMFVEKCPRQKKRNLGKNHGTVPGIHMIYSQVSLPPWISGFIILIKIKIFSFFFKNHSALFSSFKYSHVRPHKMVLTFNDTMH